MREWHHLIVDGPAATTRGFVAGALADHGAGIEPHWGEALGLEPHTLADRMRDLLLGDHHEELFLPADVADAVEAAIAAGGPRIGIRLAGRQVVTAGSFSWTVDTPSHESKAQVRARLVESLPAGVTASDVQEREDVDPDVAGTDLYARGHAFQYRASGRLSGALPGILDLYANAREMDFVRVSALTFDAAPV